LTAVPKPGMMTTINYIHYNNLRSRMMNWQTRLKIILLAILPFLLASAMLYCFTQINLVAKDPIAFDGRKFSATYATDQGVVAIKRATEESIYEVTGEINGLLKTDRHGMNAGPNGEEGFTPFWLHFSNPVLSLNTENPEYPIYDHIGVLGEPQQSYTARQEASLILMDDILQSQASYRYGIFTAAGERAGTAIYDATCGLLFRLQIKQPDHPDLRLTDTDFPISRNRVTLVIVNTLLAVLMLVLLFRQARHAAAELSEQARREAFLVLLGVLCVATDTLLDIWYPFAFGFIAPMVWHALIAIALFYFGRAGFIPATAEMAMVLAFYLYDKGSALTFFYVPGSITAFLLVLRRRALQPRREAN